VLLTAAGGHRELPDQPQARHIAQIEARYGLSIRIEADAHMISPDFKIERFKTATRRVRSAPPTAGRPRPRRRNAPSVGGTWADSPIVTGRACPWPVLPPDAGAHSGRTGCCPNDTPRPALGILTRSLPLLSMLLSPARLRGQRG
jgi:hypothetical protein